MSIVGYIHTVNQAKVVDVDRDFRVVNFLERIDDAFIDVASRLTRWSFHWRLLQKAVEIIAFALHRFTRGRRIVINARLARRFDAVHLFDRNFPFLVHPKIFLTLSIPRTSAALSPASLYTPKLDRKSIRLN